MNEKIVVIIGAILLSFSVIIVSFNEINRLKKGEKRKEIFYSLQDLIDNADEKSTVKLSKKVFYENIYINKSLTIEGSNKEKTIIDGKNKKSIINVNSKEVMIKNLTIRNSGGKKYDSAIVLNSNENQIIDCNIYNTRTGIFVNNSNSNTIKNCFFQDNGEGIFSRNSKENKIDNCQIRNSAFGIYLKNSEFEIIKNSYVHANGLGLYFKDSKDAKVINSAVCDNNQDGGGIWAFNSNNLEIKNCNINHNGAGLKLKTSQANISNCNFDYNMYNTFRLQDVEKTTISNCDIINSYRTGFYLENSNCDIKNCNIYNSKLYGLESDKNSQCNAKNNFWGSRFGPSITSLSQGDRLSFRPIKNKIFPWKTKEIENTGTNWNENEKFNKKELKNKKNYNIKFKEKDTDGDILPDYWEEKYGYDPSKKEDHYNLDPDNDGLNNIEECYTEKYGSNPFYRDIFIEIDYSKNNKPGSRFIEKVKEIFKEHKIALHIDTGNLDGSEEIPFNVINSAEHFSDVYWKYFLHENINNPRKGIFHYAVVVDEIKEIYSGFVFVGSNNLDTIGIATKPIQKGHGYFEKDRLVIAGIIHELGHSMGLIIDDHGGIDNLGTTKFFTKEGWMYKNYLSCLNYRYTYFILGFSDGSHGKGDFDDWSNLDFSFFKDTNFEH